MLGCPICSLELLKLILLVATNSCFRPLLITACVVNSFVLDVHEVMLKFEPLIILACFIYASKSTVR